MNVLDQFHLDGRVAVITGGSKGLGRSMAEGLAQAGAQVALISRHEEQAQAVASELGTSNGHLCRGYGADVTEPDQVNAVVTRVLADFGRIDILINNAGINLRGPIDLLSLSEFEQVYATNVRGPWLMCRAIGLSMKAQHFGRVINIGSMLSVVGMADRTPYATSKGAILQMTRALALEWAPHGITVNAILPGPFATEMNQSLLADPTTYQRFVAMIPLGRWGELAEIQGLAVFLASDAASYITGAAIAIDGGMTAQ